MGLIINIDVKQELKATVNEEIRADGTSLRKEFQWHEIINY
jgi:hypothetical protein